jgi:hypothetical protein
MKLTCMLARWLFPFAATGAVVVACGSAPADSTGQASEAVSASSETSLFGHCNVEWIGRTPPYETGYCVVDDGTKDKPACRLVESSQCTQGKKVEPYGCACGVQPPDCTLVDDTPCGALSY